MDGLPQALAGFGLDDARILYEEPAAQRNAVVHVQREDGTRLVARGHRRNSDPDRVRWQCEVQSILRTRGVPTAPALRSRCGEYVVVSEGVAWTLSRFVAGEFFDFQSLPQARAAGTCLARVHAGDAALPLPPSTGTGWNDGAEAWLSNGRAEYEALHRLFVGASVEAEMAFLQACLERAGELPSSAVDGLTVGFVHGDFHGRNVVFQDGVVAGVFDFDVARRGFLLEDVLRASYSFARPDRSSHVIRPEFAQTFLTGYGAGAGAGHANREAVGALAVFGWVRTAARYRRAAELGDDAVAAFRTNVARAGATLALVPHVTG